MEQQEEEEEEEEEEEAVAKMKLLESESESESEPKSSSFLEKWDKSAIDMGSHDSIHSTDQLPSNEHHRHGGGVSEQPHECPLHLLPPGVLVQLMNSWVHTHSTEQPLHSVAHATRAHTEYHHRALRRQPRHPL
ncbi:unnamed protein product [Camellia sinensis]